jgi:hypothetical protein
MGQPKASPEGVEKLWVDAFPVCAPAMRKARRKDPTPSPILTSPVWLIWGKSLEPSGDTASG